MAIFFRYIKNLSVRSLSYNYYNANKIFIIFLGRIVRLDSINPISIMFIMIRYNEVLKIMIPE
jgi:hypothetical protein